MPPAPMIRRGGAAWRRTTSSPTRSLWWPGWAEIAEPGTWPESGVPDAGALTAHVARTTLSYMKTSPLTIRLDADLEALLARVCEETGKTRSEVVREALRRQLALELFEDARRRIIPFAEEQGILTDEDVYRIVS